jgi:hypothetical protein
MARVALPRRLRLECWVATAAAACAGPAPLDLFVAPILLGVDPPLATLAATLTVLGPLVVAFRDGAGMRRACKGSSGHRPTDLRNPGLGIAGQCRPP